MADENEFVTEERLQARLLDERRAMAYATGKMITDLSKQIAALEKKVQALQEIPGALAIAGIIDRLEKTLRAPVRPMYDAAGKLVGARRVPKDEDSTGGASNAASLRYRPAAAQRGGFVLSRFAIPEERQ